MIKRMFSLILVFALCLTPMTVRAAGGGAGDTGKEIDIESLRSAISVVEEAWSKETRILDTEDVGAVNLQLKYLIKELSKNGKSGDTTVLKNTLRDIGSLLAQRDRYPYRLYVNGVEASYQDDWNALYEAISNVEDNIEKINQLLE